MIKQWLEVSGQLLAVLRIKKSNLN